MPARPALTLLAALLLPAAPGCAAEAGAVVAADGTGQYRSIQEAINAAPQSRGAGTPWTIRVRPGIYPELVYVQREKRFVRLVGDDPATTTVTFGLYAAQPGPDGKPLGTFHTPTVWIDADDFAVEGLTIANSAGPVGQALALRVDGDRVRFVRCRFTGWQDTVLANRGRQYFRDCAIVGAVDFIFGGATAFFDHCDLTCAGTGYITAASTPEGQAYGFVFGDCRIAGSRPAIRSFLGRPWRPHAAVTFVRTAMSEVVRPAGWDNWRAPERERTARFAEYGSIGPGSSPAGRVAWASTLTAAAGPTPREVLGGSDGWDPR